MEQFGVENRPAFQVITGDPDDVHITSSLLETVEKRELVEESTDVVVQDCSESLRVNGQSSSSVGNQDPNLCVQSQELNGQLPCKEEQAASENYVNNTLEMFNILHDKKRVRFEALVLNRDSFARTAANILTLSLLVKDGRAEVKAEQNQSYFIVPRNILGPQEPSTENYVKFMYHFNYKDWELMRQQVQAGEELMSSAAGTKRHWPLVIPKGIRRKAKRRKDTGCETGKGACELDINAEQMDTVPMDAIDQPETEEHRRKQGAASPTEQDAKMTADANEPQKPPEEKSNLSLLSLTSVAIAGESAAYERNPPRPLMTYSRRLKKQTDTSGRQLLKRYSRRMLDGDGYPRKRTLLVFEEFLTKPKSCEEEETIFQRLAKAPRRRRTGFPEASQTEAYSITNAASTLTALQVFPAKPKLEDTETGEELKPIVIAPKRFKKSGFGPRQALRARIKARLKASLQQQAPLPPKIEPKIEQS